MLCLFLLSTMLAASDGRAQVRAGTPVENQARLRWTEGEADGVASNIDMVVVAERLDVTLARAEGRAVTLVNGGNGQEVFLLSATGQDGTAAGVFLDRNGNGQADPDERVDRTPALDPGGTATLVLDGAVALEARAATGSGAPGTILAGQGDGGTDAVVGPTGARASLRLEGSGPVLDKAQEVRGPDGSARAVAGAVITYTLLARFDAAVSDAVLSDALPAGTRPVAGSLSLDGQPLTEVADADPGRLDGRTLTVTLGDVPAATTRRVRFQVIIE